MPVSVRVTAAVTILVFVLSLAAAPVAGSARALPSAQASSDWKFKPIVIPRALPASSPAPVALVLSNRFAATGGSAHTLRTLAVRADSDLGVQVEGLPICKRAQLLSVDDTEAKRICKRALLGRGTEDIEVTFSGAAPLAVRTKLLIFNGGSRAGLITLLLHGFTAAPTPTAIVTEIKIRKIHSGPYGTEFFTSVPKIAGGSGSVTSLDLKINEMVTHRGRGMGVVNARCSNGRLRFEGTARFVGGDSMSRASSVACTAKR